jgi:phospholipid/cholesterol/gamma-HCH transport system ATP-binding protein
VDVHKAFGEHQVLTGVTLDLYPGRCTFIIGPSGTGKSVMVRHLVGLHAPDAGEIYYEEERVDTLSETQLLELRKRCVYVFQHPTLFDFMTVLQNVALVTKYHLALKPEEADRVAAQQLDKMGLSHHAQSRPTELSAGEQKLVSLARALALNPRTLILDEPTTGLDPYAAYKLDQQVLSLIKTGVTLFIISHDLRSIERLADDVVFLLKGKIRYYGPKAGFFGSRDPAVRQFVEGRTDGEI